MTRALTALALLIAITAGPAIATAPAAAGDLPRATGIAKSVYPPPCRLIVQLGLPATPGANAEAYRTSCTIRVRPDVASGFTDAELCALMVHEAGHIAGVPHSLDPRSTMYAYEPTNLAYSGPPPHPACGPTDAELDARASARAELRAARAELRRYRRCARSSHPRRRRRCARAARSTRRDIRRIRARLR